MVKLHQSESKSDFVCQENWKYYEPNKAMLLSRSLFAWCGLTISLPLVLSVVYSFLPRNCHRVFFLIEINCQLAVYTSMFLIKKFHLLLGFEPPIFGLRGQCSDHDTNSASVTEGF